MNIAGFSIKRPVFVVSLVFVSMFLGLFGMMRMGVDFFPKMEIPVVVVTVPYIGALPEEVETLISKPIEEEVSSISGLDEMYSLSKEGISVVICQFKMETNIQDAEQQVRNKLSAIRRNLPDDIEEPNIERVDFDAVAAVRLAVSADLNQAELYQLVDKEIKPVLEQADNVGSVTILGGREREIQIELDRNQLNRNELSASGIAQQLGNYGVNTPLGSYKTSENETSFRTVGRFTSLQEIRDVVVSFGGDFSSFVPLSRVAKISDGLEDEETSAYLYAPKNREDFDFKKASFLQTVFNVRSDDNKPIEREYRTSMLIDVVKQSGSNTVKVAGDVIKRIELLNKKLETMKGKPQLIVVVNQADFIESNIEDVVLSIVVGILLAVFIVYFFLGNVRSTIITGLALPNSLLGAFALMYLSGFTANVMTLLALSLAVGLLIDDAIVVRENIFKKMEEGQHPVRAAETGTMQVIMAVFATSMVIMAVFIPMGSLSGMIGQIFKEFAFTVVFALIISTLDAIAMAPMLSAYFAGNINHKPNFLIRGFNKFQDYVDVLYKHTLHFSIAHPLIIILATGIILGGSFLSLRSVKTTFIPAADRSEFMVSLQMPSGTSLEGTKTVAHEIEKELMKIPEVHYMSTVVGDDHGEANPVMAEMVVILRPYHKRIRDSIDIKAEVHSMLQEKFSTYETSVNDYELMPSGSSQPFEIMITGADIRTVEEYSTKLANRLKAIPQLIDVRANFEAGKPEFQIRLNPKKLQQVAVTPAAAGRELRLHIAGGVVAKLYEGGEEYDIRMRLKPDQRNLESAFYNTQVPNMHGKLIPLSAVGEGSTEYGPSIIRRQFRTRAVPVVANLAKGASIGPAIEETKKIIKKELPLPEGVQYVFRGDAENLGDLQANMLTAVVLAVIFIYLALASLYESFITPFTILLALPPAVSGAFYALALTGQTLNLFSMIGIVMLLGLVAKNSILLVDFAMQEIREKGLNRNDAIFNAGVSRLRPILMTSVAMIGGMIPVAIGIGEAAKARTSMGIAIIGGIILSTLVSLVVVPSVFAAIDRFRVWVEGFFTPDYDFKLVGKAWAEELAAENEKNLPTEEKAKREQEKEKIRQEEIRKEEETKSEIKEELKGELKQELATELKQELEKPAPKRRRTAKKKPEDENE